MIVRCVYVVGPEGPLPSLYRGWPLSKGRKHALNKQFYGPGLWIRYGTSTPNPLYYEGTVLVAESFMQSSIWLSVKFKKENIFRLNQCFGSGRILNFSPDLDPTYL